MTPEQWKRARAVFDAAVERAGETRTAYVAEACAGDHALRATVESLLRADAEVTGVLDRAAWDGAGLERVDDEPEALVGARLGDYEVKGLVGQGGMGVVYHGVRADDAFRKRVAIKLIKRGLDSAFVVRRFRHEREILASLDHPNVARLMDAGTAPDGRPYFVMEYVDGRPIDRYCDENGLDVRARVALFREACAAVAYAHQHLVVHRDLKPGNILITPDGTPKLLDFGVAKLLDPASPSEATATGLLLMTPEYASPEQVRGERITTATDVYALGVLLYELLAGKKPYVLDTRRPEEVARVVCLTEPERPSAAAPRERRRALRGDLDNIVLTALRKEPERRYASVERLAADLDRHLERRPVQARPDTFWYRTGRLVRRNRLATALLAALVAWVGIATWQAHVARVERARAERRFQDVRGLAHSLMFEVHDAVRDLDGSTKARELVVQKGLEYLSRLAADAGQDPALRLELGLAYRRIGEIQYVAGSSSKGDSKAALESYAQGAALLRPLAQSGVPAARSGLAGLLFSQATVLNGRGEFAAAEACLQEALLLDEALVAANPRDRAARRHLIDVHRRLAGVLAQLSRLGPGLEHQRQAVAMAEDLVKEPGTEAADEAALVRAYRDLGESLRMAGDLDGALRVAEKAEVPTRERLRREPASVAAREAMATLDIRKGDIHMHRSEHEPARRLFQEAIDIQRALLREDPANGRARGEIAAAGTRLCEALILMGRSGEALPACRESYDIAMEEWRQSPTDDYAWGAAIGHYWMARCAELSNDAAAARRHHDAAVQILSDLGARKPSAEFKAILAEEQRAFAAYLEAHGGLREAASLLRQAADLYQAVAAADPDDYETPLALAQARALGARVALRQGEKAGACSLARAAEDGFAAVGARHPIPAAAAEDRTRLAPVIRACAGAPPVSPLPAERRGLQ